MSCVGNEHIVICSPSIDAWRRVFTHCPICRTRRLVLGEFQDWYGERFTCLTCGTGWLDGEYRRVGKREKVNVVTRAKSRIKEYRTAGIPQGFDRFMERLRSEQVQFESKEG